MKVLREELDKNEDRLERKEQARVRAIEQVLKHKSEIQELEEKLSNFETYESRVKVLEDTIEWQKEEIRKLRNMIDLGLGWEDMQRDS